MKIMYADGEKIDKWTEDSGLLGEIQGGFRRGMRTEDNMYMLERLIEMVKGIEGGDMCGISGHGECIRSKVNRKKLFNVMRCYGGA